MPSFESYYGNQPSISQSRVCIGMCLFEIAADMETGIFEMIDPDLAMITGSDITSSIGSCSEDYDIMTSRHSADFHDGSVDLAEIKSEPIEPANVDSTYSSGEWHWPTKKTKKIQRHPQRRQWIFLFARYDVRLGVWAAADGRKSSE